MDRTPTAGKHYEILEITGDAYAIERRALEIESLGEQMLAAADILDKVALGAECRGESLDKLAEVAEDVKGDLRKAGDRYYPSGTVLVEYARALDGVQTTLAGLMPAIETAWSQYEAVKGQFAADSQLPPPAEGESAEDRTSQGDVEAKYEAWKDQAVLYEGAYDTWWTAYENARKGIKDANDNGVEDSWLDDALPVLDALGKALSYAGIVLAVAACIVGGPFILAAALVGLAALAVTAARYAGGRATVGDILMAAVGVFPFGKAFALAKGLKATPTLATLGRGLRAMGGDVVGAGFRNGARLRGVIASGTTARVLHAGGNLNRNGSQVLRTFFRGIDSPTALTRLLRGYDGAWGQSVSTSASRLSNAATNNLNRFLGGTPNGNVMQDMLGGSNPVLDFVDGLGKASGGFAYDRSTDGW